MSPNKVSMSLLFLLLVSISLSSSSPLASYDSVYDLLKAYGLPKGIIPKGVTINDFTFNPTSGKLQIHFPHLPGNGICKVTRTEYVLGIPVYNRVELKSSISATLKFQRLVNIEGITATVKFGWITLCSNCKIVELKVTSDGKYLQFISSIPFVNSPKFPITDEFDVPQTCEADLDIAPINIMPLLGVSLMDSENKDDNGDNYPLFFYKRALGGRRAA